MNSFPDTNHDHDRCVADALSSAEIVCMQRGARLTDLRRRVLELIWDSHSPIGAYDLIDKKKHVQLWIEGRLVTSLSRGNQKSVKHRTAANAAKMILNAIEEASS